MAEESSIHPYVSGMAAVHRIYKSSLDAAPDYIESARGDDTRRVLIANFYANVLASLENHHVGEDELYFPLLIERAPEQAEIVNLGLEQHQQVLALVAAAQVATAAWESTGDAEGPGLVRVLGSLNEALSAHCDREEATIVPLLTVHLSAEEWNMLHAHGAANFKGDKYWLIVGLRLECSSPEERARVLDHMAPQRREWWETVGRPSFNDMMAEVRQTD
jgi:hemerythrin HHE cation binding domain-containing protein